MISLGVRHELRHNAQSREAQVTRTIFAIATALLGATMLFASSAEACISCEYKPEVVHNPASSHAARNYEKKRVGIASKVLSARPAKARVAKTEAIAKKVETAKIVPVETQPENESKSIATASSVDAEATPAEEPKVAQDVGCKKFFSAVGMALTVPCE